MDSSYVLFAALDSTQPLVCRTKIRIKSQHVPCTVTCRSYNTQPLFLSAPLTNWSLLYERCVFTEVEREF